MLSIRYLSLCLILLFLVGCTDTVSPPVLQSPVDFTLNFGGTINVDDGELILSFTKIVSDSRCPTKVVCVWAGEATINLHVKKRGEEAIDLPLTAYADEEDTIGALNYMVDTLGYRFSLRSLNPYPEDPDKPIPAVWYSARLRVTSLNSLTNEIRLTNSAPSQFLLAEYEVDSVYISDEELHVAVSFGGGCRPHDFTLFMSPAGFLESSPVQANLYLQHVNHLDACRAYVHEWHTFDISALADAYRKGYQSGGTVQLNVYEFDSGAIQIARSLLIQVSSE